jgi:hypothetical protein
MIARLLIAEIVQTMLKSSTSLPDTLTRQARRDNVKPFVQGVMVTGYLHNSLTDYVFESHIA